MAMAYFAASSSCDVSERYSKSLSAIRTRLLERFNFSFLKWSSQLVGCHGCGIRFFQRQSVNQQAEAEKKHVFTKEENTDEPQSHNE
ncbi:hypothetical protein Y032_0069g301 [Ancylostoma ceylanicum]|nr:hypothetical protein Y032_0069g301 [Ancylostoma ceylanicum]